MSGIVGCHSHARQCHAPRCRLLDSRPRPNLILPISSSCYHGVRVICAASSSDVNDASTFRTTPSGSPYQSLSREEISKILSGLLELAQEATKLSIEAGPQGLLRGARAGQAIFQVVQEQVASGTPDPPEVILRKLFEKLGATYIKLGQFIASSPSLFPDAYVLEFQKCLDKTDPVPFEQIEKIIKSELSVPIDQAFSHISPEPLASASIAQVHEAQLRGSNQTVVIKVLKPGVEDILRTDLTFLYLGAKLLTVVNPSLERTSIAGILEDIRTSMLDEVDFNKEAEHIRQFSAYLDSTGMRSSATCPFVYSQYSSKRVLVMEKIEGVALTDLNAIRSITSADPEATLIRALNTWAGSVLYCETFHADVHAGNLLVMADGRLGFIDFGIVGTLSPVTWRAVQTLITATAVEDYLTMARALSTLKATDAEVDVEAFAADLEQLFVAIRAVDTQVDVSATGAGLAADVTVDSTQANRLLLEFVRVGEVHGIRFPREFGLLVKQTLYFDKYIQLLAPELEVFQDGRVSLGKMGRAPTSSDRTDSVINIQPDS